MPMARRDGREARVLEIRLLGSLELEFDGRPLGLAVGKGIRLVALLAASDSHRLSRPDLLARLGASDVATNHGLATLAWAVNDRVRGLLGRALVVGSTNAYGLSDEVPVEVDVERFRAHLGSAQAFIRQGMEIGWERELEAALGWYRGDLALDDDAPSLIDRQRYHELALEAMAQLAQQHLRAGRFDAALRRAEGMLELDPFDEAGHRLAIAALAASGNRSAALRRYRLCEAILERELGLRPGPELAALLETIRGG